jgi:hypothetical protein
MKREEKLEYLANKVFDMYVEHKAQKVEIVQLQDKFIMMVDQMVAHGWIKEDE